MKIDYDADAHIHFYNNHYLETTQHIHPPRFTEGIQAFFSPFLFFLTLLFPRDGGNTEHFLSGPFFWLDHIKDFGGPCCCYCCYWQGMIRRSMDGGTTALIY